jgi:rhodanese-related sulfurtransferase
VSTRTNSEPKSVDQLLAEARRTLPRRVSPAEAWAELQHGALLIDIRGDDQRHRDGLIPGATVIPRNTLEWRCDPASPWHHESVADHTQRILLLCDEGYQSSLAAAALQQLGLRHATDVDGGFQAWREQGLPVSGPRSRRPTRSSASTQ